jgi:hypothetical protein
MSREFLAMNCVFVTNITIEAGHSRHQHGFNPAQKDCWPSGGIRLVPDIALN